MFVLVSNKWSNYLNGNLGDLRNEGTLCDVTLAGNDAQTHLAHSSMLAAASNVLKSCLVQAPRGHYVVKIPSISGQVWELLLHFIYEGRVRVTAEQRSDLLSASQTLGLGELQSLLKACTQGGSQFVSVAATKGLPEPKQPDYTEPSTSQARFGQDQPDMGDSVVLDENSLVGQKLEPTEATSEEEAKTNKKPLINKYGEPTKYTCTLCGKSFPWGKSLHIHELMHKQKKNPGHHQCGTCNKPFGSYHSLRAHERTHSFHPYKCQECSAGFHFQVNFELHMWKKHQKEPVGGMYSCKLCLKTFIAKGLLHRHLSQVHGLKREKENKVVTNKKEVKNSPTCHCGLCQTGFSSRDLVKEHFVEKHQVEQPEFCDVCDYAFESNAKVLEHCQIHVGKARTKLSEAAAAVLSIKPDMAAVYKCEVCQTESKSIRLLTKHMRTHEGQVTEDLWRCPVCAAEFDNKPDFSMHIAEHRGEKTYNCKYCEKGFTHKGNYATHVQRHLGIKPYSCNYCPKRFVRKDDMKSHLRVHTGEKPFPCQVCNVKFSCISNLREHERAKHNVSFSKRNPNVVVPRQHRPKVKYRSKNVAQFNLTHPSEDLLRIGVIQEVPPGTSSSTVQSVQPLIHNPESVQQIPVTTTESQLENSQLIVREGGQEEYYQVVDTGDGTQTLTPILQFDQKAAQITFTIEGNAIAKMEEEGEEGDGEKGEEEEEGEGIVTMAIDGDEGGGAEASAVATMTVKQEGERELDIREDSNGDTENTGE